MVLKVFLLARLCCLDFYLVRAIFVAGRVGVMVEFKALKHFAQMMSSCFKLLL